jgi:hypothetical protein
VNDSVEGRLVLTPALSPEERPPQHFGGRYAPEPDRGIYAASTSDVLATWTRQKQRAPKTRFMGRKNLQYLDANRGHEPLNLVGRHSVEPTLPTQEARAIASIFGCRGRKGKMLALLASLRSITGSTESLPTERCNPVGVERPWSAIPRVARSSQPWALRQNPVGIQPGDSLAERGTNQKPTGSFRARETANP